MITTQDALTGAIDAIKHQSLIAVDTEFIREKTYYPQLCLIQIAYGDDVALIDPLSGIDLQPLKEILCNADILKLFHSGQQDLEIFYQLLGEPVYPIFDTQVAAALVGMTDQVGYGTYIRTLLGLDLEKGNSFSVWAKRPLTQSQLQYAADDVVYLLKSYPVLLSKLKKMDRLSWLEDDFAYRESLEYVSDIAPEKAFRHVKRASTLNPRQAAVAREVAAWRQERAIKLDRPRRHILADECIVEIARKKPKSGKELKDIRGLSSYALQNKGSILEAVQAGMKKLPNELPVMKGPDKANIEIEASAQLARALLTRRAKEYHIAPTVLASNAMIEEFVRTPNESSKLLQGWRKMMVGDELLALMQGKIHLSIKDGKLQVVTVNGGSD